MGNDYFPNAASKAIVKELDAIAATEGQRANVFADWLSVVLCCLAGETMEAEYLATIKRYVDSPRKGSHLAHLSTATAVLFTELGEPDLLGDIFQGGITWGEHGQFFTPWEICRLMASLTGQDQVGSGSTLHDPACGSGRTLLASAKVAGPLAAARLYTGMDVDGRCAKMCAVNLALKGLTGWVVHGNSLSMELHAGYLVAPFEGKNFPGMIRKVDPRSLVFAEAKEMPAAVALPAVTRKPEGKRAKAVQADLFSSLEAVQ